jgi:hypothetical protein
MGTKLVERLDEIEARWAAYYEGKPKRISIKRAYALASGDLAILAHNPSFNLDFWVKAPPAPLRTVSGGDCEVVEITEAELIGATVLRDYVAAKAA